MHPGKKFSQTITVSAPLLWSDKTPVLYQLRSTLLLNNQELDETLTTFGIRSLRFDKDKGLFVNEKPVKLKGVCVHQDAGSFGNAVPIAVWAYRFGILKEMGCNAIRTSHHPFAPEFYDLCDKMGFYVFDEAFDEWTRDWTLNYTLNTRGKSKFGYHLYFKQWYETDLRAMLHRVTATTRVLCCIVLATKSPTSLTMMAISWRKSWWIFAMKKIPPDPLHQPATSRMFLRETALWISWILLVIAT